MSSGMCGRFSIVFVVLTAVIATLHPKIASSFCLRPSQKPVTASPEHGSLIASSRLFCSAAAAPSTTTKEMVLKLKDPPVKPFSPGPRLTIMDLIYKMFPKYDPTRKIPIIIGNIFGHVLLFLTRCYPVVKGKENISSILGKDDQSSSRACMFVANHCSWMDIPFIACSVIGMKNYKMVSKKELLKVPILSKSLTVADHVILDRADRKSQLQAYKKGIHYLKEKVHLVTFAEGTRSRDGRLQPFKRGAFKMAQATQSPIVPVSIKYAHLVNPVDFAWPMRSAMSIPAEVIIGKPIETANKNDDELLLEVRQAIVDNLPESQRPKPDTRSSA